MARRPRCFIGERRITMGKYLTISVVVILLSVLALNCYADGTSTVQSEKIISITNPIETSTDGVSRLSTEEFLIYFKTWMDAWKAYIHTHRGACVVPILPEEVRLLKMGKTIIPAIIDIFEQDAIDGKLSQNERQRLITMERMITWKGFQPVNNKSRSLSEQMQLIVKWWNEDRKNTPAILNGMYTKWDIAVKANKDTDAYASLEEIRYMGIEALPFIMDKIKGGDHRLLNFVRELARNDSIGDNPSLDTVLLWWEKNKDRLTLPDPEPEVTIASPAPTTTGASSTTPVKSAAP